MKIIEAHQVPYGNVSPNIFKLPCVNSVKKKNGIEYSVFTNGKFAYPSMAHARPTDWICKREDGTWTVFTDKEYQSRKGGGA